jgi:hypothetical protein
MGAARGNRRMLAIAFLLLTRLQAAIVDRIAATVDFEVITDSQVSDALRVTAFIDGVAPDLSSDNRRKVLDQLIDQALVRREVEFTRFQQAPAAEAEPSLQQVKQRFPDERAYREALAKSGITEQQLIANLSWQLTMLRFIEYRFQPAVQVTNAEIRQEYRRQAAAWREKNATDPPTLQQIRPEVEKIVRQRLTDSALDRWLGEVRTQSSILYREGYK